MNLKWLPNALTFSRWIVAPFVLVFALRGDWWISAGLLYWAAFTDMIDGTLARKFGVAGSKFGECLDRYGDFTLVFCTAVGLLASGWSPFFEWGFFLGYLATIILEIGKRKSRKKGLMYSIFSEVLRLYYLGVIAVIIVLYTVRANGGIEPWIIIVTILVATIAFLLKKGRMIAF